MKVDRTFETPFHVLYHVGVECFFFFQRLGFGYYDHNVETEKGEVTGGCVI